ncbi:MAG: hypothetical protein ABIG45_04755 [Bacillota bacterium]
MKFRMPVLLIVMLVLFCGIATAQDAWIPETADPPLIIAPEWDEPDTPLGVMARADGLIYFTDIDAPLKDYLQTSARCVFESLRPSQLMQRLAWVKEVDVSPYAGTLTDARWLYMFGNLKKITLTDATLTDLSVIGGFTNLIELTLINCGHFDLTPLVSCEDLAALSIGWGDEYRAASGEFDLTPLKALKNLKTLGLYGSGIRSVEPLASFSRRLRALTLSDTAIEDYAPLSDFLNLNALTLDLLHSDAAAQILRAVPRDIKTLTLSRIILDGDAWDTAKRFNSLTDYTLTDCDVTDPLFYETLNKATRLTLDGIGMPDGGMIGKVYADKTTMVLRGVPEAIMISMLSTRSSYLQTLTIDVEALTENLSAALRKKTSLNKVTVGVKADADLSGDVWGRISGIRDLTIDSAGKTLLSTDFLSALTHVRTLTLSGVEVADTAGIATLSNLSQLNVYGCRIADWSFLSNLQGLTIVKVYGSELANDALPYFAALRALDDLRLNGNRITDISALTASQTIRKLDILSNPIADYTPLLEMPALRTV